MFLSDCFFFVLFYLVNTVLQLLDMSLTGKFPSDEIKRKFRPYDKYDLKRIIRIYY